MPVNESHYHYIRDIKEKMCHVPRNFHEEKEEGGIKFWAYTAGHVLGAAMFMIEIAGMYF